MEEQDPIKNKFESSFADYTQEPPDRVWDNLRRELHPEIKPDATRTGAKTFSLFANKPLGFYIALSGVALTVLLTVIYLGSRDHHSIRGHAYAGDFRLRGGSAELFQVVDKAMPWDSVTHYRSAIIDNSGHFQFSQVGSGKYILRIAPDGKGEAAIKYLPSWFDDHEKSDSCKQIIINNNDVNVEGHLILKSE